MQSNDEAPIERLVQAHIAGGASFHFLPEEGGVAACDPDGQVIAGLVAAGAQFDSNVVIFIRHLVVDPAWRGQGVGVVALGVLPQLKRAALYVGNCAANAARFYQRAGYTVLDPGQPLPFPFGKQAVLQLTNDQYPCWFYK
ncbi:GNAT family N-acetyltransferase [Modestobacter excelsi]|uniref:GNAT family N-acetyltransferase n=1 Tax=Modestobacter excelsi TaxID=2213161 RepID=UPI001C20CCDD|nr:GNAT family N-acetyltransferase [Modestobacter excelsi]